MESSPLTELRERSCMASSPLTELRNTTLHGTQSTSRVTGHDPTWHPVHWQSYGIGPCMASSPLTELRDRALYGMQSIVRDRALHGMQSVATLKGHDPVWHAIHCTGQGP
jgi:hypothetical protein